MPEEKNGATLEYKYYLNGFPKSGLHLIAAMMLPIVRPLPAAGVFDRPWAGTFQRNSWTTEWIDLEKVLYRAGRLMAGHFRSDGVWLEHGMRSSVSGIKSYSKRQIRTGG